VCRSPRRMPCSARWRREQTQVTPWRKPVDDATDMEAVQGNFSASLKADMFACRRCWDGGLAAAPITAVAIQPRMTSGRLAVRACRRIDVGNAGDIGCNAEGFRD